MLVKSVFQHYVQMMNLLPDLVTYDHRICVTVTKLTNVLSVGVADIVYMMVM